MPAGSRPPARRPKALRQAITRKLDTQTPDPQITVQPRGRRRLDRVDLGLCRPRRASIPIERPTRTLATMLAKAGGVTIEPAVAIVRVTRGSQTGKVWLKDLYANPALDIALRPGDQIVVEQDTRAFIALGATGAQNRVPFETQTLSALEAIATVGGLNSQPGRPDRRLRVLATNRQRSPMPCWAATICAATSAWSMCWT